MWRIGAALLTALGLAACGGGGQASRPLPGAPAGLRLSSSAFTNGAALPRRFTCDGAGVSPPLAWSVVPRRARELVLTVEDPDAAGFVHWTVLGISPRPGRLPEGRRPPGAVETTNGFGRSGWGAPCPPKGAPAHRYVFALYATDAPLGLGAGASPGEVRARLAAHAIARGVITARYARG